MIGGYPKTQQAFPIGPFTLKNLLLQGGQCNHRKYIPRLIEMTQAKAFDPLQILTHMEPVMNAIDAYKAFDTRAPGWIKVELEPQLQQ